MRISKYIFSQILLQFTIVFITLGRSLILAKEAVFIANFVKRIKHTFFLALDQRGRIFDLGTEYGGEICAKSKSNTNFKSIFFVVKSPTHIEGWDIFFLILGPIIKNTT